MGTKYSISKKILINAKPEYIFGVLADIENWSLWTSSIKEILIINDTRLSKGTKVRIVQPKLLPAVWEITEIEKNKYFTMEKRYVGLKMIAKHILEPRNNTTSVELVMIYEGILAKLFYSLTSSLTSQYLTMEINGLKNKCEKVSQVNREALKFFI